MRILKVSQEAKVQVAVTIGQESDFERLNEVLDAGRILKQGRDHDQGSQFRGNAHRKNPFAAADAASPVTWQASSPASTAS